LAADSVEKMQIRIFKGGHDMFESIDKAMLAGLGALSMTREKAEKIFDEYVSRGEAEKKGKKGFVKDIMDSAEKTKAELADVVGKQLRKTSQSLGLATKEDLARLEEKVDILLKESRKK
jgi:polyhydroxyalkanoate synthesis regulator phasin